MTRTKFRVTLALAILFLLVALYAICGVAMAPLSVVACNNHFALTADNPACRAPILWELVAALSFFISVALGLLAVIRRPRIHN